MTIYTGKKEGVDIKYAKGYNPNKWDADLGFKATSGFPTTGFEKAEFSVIGSGSDQSKYKCTVTGKDNTQIRQSPASATTGVGEGCTITYLSPTRSHFNTGDTLLTIILEHNTSNMATANWVEKDIYTVPAPKLWATGRGTQKFGNTNYLKTSTQFDVLDTCRGGTTKTTTTQGRYPDSDASAYRAKYLFYRDELTNSPNSNRISWPEGSAPQYISDYFSRDVDGAFMSEWGFLKNYVGSPFATGLHYWTAEASSSDFHFSIGYYGVIQNRNPNDSGVVAVCRD